MLCDWDPSRCDWKWSESALQLCWRGSRRWILPKKFALLACLITLYPELYPPGFDTVVFPLNKETGSRLGNRTRKFNHSYDPNRVPLSLDSNYTSYMNLSRIRIGALQLCDSRQGSSNLLEQLYREREGFMRPFGSWCDEGECYHTRTLCQGCSESRDRWEVCNSTIIVCE